MLDIGAAVDALRAGHFVRRAGWNGKGMYLMLLDPAHHLPESWGDATAAALKPQPYVAIKDAQNRVVPWLCSQTDLLAVDWEITTL